MSKHNVVEMSGRDRSRNELTELIPDGARKLINHLNFSLDIQATGSHVP